MASARPTPVETPAQTASYERDFQAWARHTVELLRAGRINEVDWGHTAEEIEGLANRDQREVTNRLKVLLLHLLKWPFQPGRRDTSRSWRNTIRTQRDKLQDILNGSPSLRRHAQEVLPTAYRRAVLSAGDETRLPSAAFPPGCPFSLEQALDDEFWPE